MYKPNFSIISIRNVHGPKQLVVVVLVDKIALPRESSHACVIYTADTLSKTILLHHLYKYSVFMELAFLVQMEIYPNGSQTLMILSVLN